MMTDAARGGRRLLMRRPKFYLVMSLVLAAIVTFGFSHTVPHDFVSPGLPPLLQIHAAVFVAWVLLFVAQPAFIVAGSPVIHRIVGWVGIGLAATMVVMGCAAILFALWANSLPSFYPAGLFLVRGILGLVVFTGLIVAAVARRRQPEWHKRLILCASIVIIVPGLERALPVPIMGPSWSFMVDGFVDLLALAGPVRDIFSRGRVHPAYYWGVGAIVAEQALTDLLAPSALARGLLHLLGAS
jgi:hypothetical protein